MIKKILLIFFILLLFPLQNVFAEGGWYRTLQSAGDVSNALPLNGQALVYDDVIQLWTPADISVAGVEVDPTVDTADKIEAILTNDPMDFGTGSVTSGGGFVGDVTGDISGSSGSCTGLAATATALAANGANAAAGNAILGVDASGAAEGSFDVWTEAENTAAAYLSSEVDGSTTNEINTITCPDANVTAGLGITFAQSGSIAITEAADTITFTVTETDPNSLLTAGTDNVLGSHINWGTGATQVSAVDVPIADVGSIITGTEVEGALQENRTAIDLNTAKNTNVSTTLTAGTVNATTYGITSDSGVDDIVLPEADTTNAGILGSDKWDEIVANSLKTTESTSVTTPITLNGVSVGIVNQGTTTQVLHGNAAGNAAFGAIVDNDVPNDITIDTAAVATEITAVANNNTDETVYPTFVDGATGTQGIETDTGLTYNPLTGILTSTTFSGALSGNATTASTASACSGESATVATITTLPPDTQNTYSRTQYLIPYASTTTAMGQIAIGTDGQILTSGGAGVAPSFEDLPDGAIQFTFDGGGSAIATDTTAWIYVPYTGTLTGWDLTCDTSATITIDVWDEAYSSFPPDNADSMCNGNEPSITAGIKNTSADLSGWSDTTITKGEYIKVNVDSNDSATKCVLVLKVEK